jgi:hypothetical protein
MYADTVTAAKDRIAQIETAIAAIQAQLEQDKNDIGKLDWANVGDLGATAEMLTAAAKFYGEAQ